MISILLYLLASAMNDADCEALNSVVRCCWCDEVCNFLNGNGVEWSREECAD
jgi:hypothetical protein